MNKKHFCLLPPFIRKFGMIPESYKIAMTYEEQLLWLCKYVEDTGLEIENIKVALQNIEDEFNSQVERIDTLFSNDEILNNLIASLSERVDSIATETSGNTTAINNLPNTYGIHSLSQDVILSDENVDLEKGYYYTGNYQVLSDDTPAQTYIEKDSYFYYSPTAGAGYTPCFKVFNIDDDPTQFYSIIDWDFSLQAWDKEDLTYTKTVNASSTDTEVPSAKAVYQAIQGGGGGGGTTDYDMLSNRPQINGVTLTGNLSSSDLGIDGIPILDSDFNVWETDSGIYKVEQGVKIVYGTGTLPNDEHTVKNDIAILIVGKYNSTHFDFTLIDKESNLALNDSALYQGHSIVVDSYTVNGEIYQVISPNSNYESMDRMTTSITPYVTDLQYPSAKAVYDFVQDEQQNYFSNIYNLEYAESIPSATTHNANGWYQMGSGITSEIVPAGTYLIIGQYQNQANNATGVVTNRLKVDGNEVQGARITVPVVGNVYVSGSGISIVTFNTTTSHTFTVEGYGNVSWKDGDNYRVKLINLSVGNIISPDMGTLESISVTSNPTKLVYNAGEYFNSTGCVITATYTNGTVNVTPNCNFVCHNPLQEGDSSVTVEFEDKVTYITITTNPALVQAPASTKLLMHLNSDLKNAVTNSTTGITGTYSRTEGKFDYGHQTSGSTNMLGLQGFGNTSTNWGLGWWTKAGQSNAGNVSFNAKETNSSSYVSMLTMGQSGTDRYLSPNASAFTISNPVIDTPVSADSLYGNWNYYAIQINNGVFYGYINGVLTYHADVVLKVDLGYLQNNNSSTGNAIDEIIIADDNVYQVNRNEWKL